MNNFQILTVICEKKRLPFTFINLNQNSNHDHKKILTITSGKKRFYSKYGLLSVFPNLSYASKIAKSKLLTKKFLSLNNITVPNAEIIPREKILSALMEIDFKKTLVLKPINGARGKDVYILNKSNQIKNINKNTFGRYKAWLVEEYVEGLEFRIIMYKGKPICSYQRVAPFILGDGCSTLTDLLRNSNLDKQIINATIQKHKKIHKSIIPKNEKIPLLQALNLTRGSSVKDISKKFSRPLSKWCKSIYEVVPIDVCGIDVISRSGSLDDVGNLCVIEINSDPDLSVPFETYGINFIYGKIWKPVLKQFFST